MDTSVGTSMDRCAGVYMDMCMDLCADMLVEMSVDIRQVHGDACRPCTPWPAPSMISVVV